MLRFAVDPVDMDVLLDLLGHDIDPHSRYDELMGWLVNAEKMAERFGDMGVLGFDRSTTFVLVDASEHRVVALGDPDRRLAAYFEQAEKGAKLRARSRLSGELANALRTAHTRSSLLHLQAGEGRARDWALVRSPGELPDRYRQFVIEDKPCLVLEFLARPGLERCQRMLVDAFDLTPAEARLVWYLLDAGSLSAAAQAIGISPHTARNQLKSTFNKTRISSQSELLLIVSQMCALNARADDSPQGFDTVEVEAPEHRFARLKDGRRISYRLYGEEGATPVLYLHAGERSSLLPPGTHVQAKKAALALFAVDGPGIGHSEPNQTTPTFEAYQDFYLQALHALRLQRPHVCGDGKGGAHALLLAAAHPNRVASLLLVSARAPSTNLEQGAQAGRLHNALLRNPWMMDTFYGIIRQNRHSQRLRDLILNKVRWSDDDRIFLVDHKRFLDTLVLAAREALHQGVRGITDHTRCFQQPARQELSTIYCPVTYWYGARDEVSGTDITRDILQRVAPQAELRAFPGASHLIAYRHVTQILEYFAKLGA